MLISELTSKLADLDSKVAAYRLDMAAEFTRHSEEVLRSVPEDVAYRVSQAISASLTHFPSLYPPDSLNPSPLPTPTGLEDPTQRPRGSPPPILPHTSGNPKDGPAPPQQRGPHERELEFQGLFTPTYLPLLEKVDRPLHLPPVSPATPGVAAADRQPSVTSAQGSDTSDPRRRPSPLRRATNTSIDSVVSDSSSIRTRKSALRRSSGASKPPDSPRDPRRVRFDFQGQEVLPSSSPQTSATVLPETNHVREQSALAKDSYTTSLGDVEGEEDLNNPPKKVSSTQALRALSKAPLDEGTIWTIVNTESASETSSNVDADNVRRNTATNSSSQSGTQEDRMTLNKTSDLPRDEAYSKPHAQEQGLLGSHQPERTEEEHEVDDDEDSDDGAALFMVSKKGLKKKLKASQEQKMTLPVSSKAASRKSTASLQHESTIAAAAAINPGVYDHMSVAGGDGRVETSSAADETVQQPKKPMSKPPPAHEEDEDGFFEFDDDEDHDSVLIKPAPREPKKYLPDSREDEAEEDVKPATLPADKAKVPDDSPGSSPPINIDAKVRAITPEHKIPKKVPRKPEGNRPPSQSIGSLGGRPVVPGAVKDTALLAKLEKSDVDVPFFVGSVNGRSVSGLGPAPLPLQQFSRNMNTCIGNICYWLP